MELAPTPAVFKIQCEHHAFLCPGAITALGVGWRCDSGWLATESVCEPVQPCWWEEAQKFMFGLVGVPA